MLTKKSQYAFRALTFLAQQKNNEPVLIADIAVKKNIPIKFLENILLELKKSSILHSKKGKGGGYFLNKKPEEIKLAAIMRLMDGPIALLPCVSLNFYQKCSDCDEGSCGLKNVMCEVRDASLKILEEKTVFDLLQP